ncbi:bifunctional folylpolyglutamate synthase/dihydrofolate synthase [Paraurantiacibacter namhicola]|uniref:Dihydrofolate synthase/folylpolyglutamate synthase n=1 Tax=Paraurantiacibacter namhicola TaxID=645517 RepID=A0A1C7D8C4_9SPHN|nr:folylpolyglutamate synthase/dihydrofolate synthase family protein [Paraurantiacibacter namhicola]ANU07730.1 Bifunctional protein FolC [Paraurantiacibacter namhicola]
MKDFATHDDPAVQAQLNRLQALSLPHGRIGLETIRTLLDRLGNPQDSLPPTFHVAGTNGKGSTCAFLLAMLEADGKTVHSATKPHLVRYNERIRIAGELVSDAMLAALLKEVLDASEDLDPSFFEVTTAATFLAFSREPADACIIEVGLGGRFDATNVMQRPAACGIASLGIDHEHFLLVPEEGVPETPIVRIAFEKSGIARPGSPLCVQEYLREDVRLEIERRAGLAEAPLHMRGREWWADVGDAINYRDKHGELALPLPTLPGRHQADNAALAVAMLRHQDFVTVSPAAMAEGIRSASWPARIQTLGEGPLTRILPGRTVLLDGGHNADAADALAAHVAGLPQPVHAVVGMMAAKDARTFLAILGPFFESLQAVPIVGSAHIDTQELVEIARETLPASQPATSVKAALQAIADNTPAQGTVLICGSLYLAGQVLEANGEIPG